MTHLIAMWSGPRNISTAMMRSWGARPDTVVCDEPLYAAYLARTGFEHPGRDEILAACETDPGQVIETLLTPPSPPPPAPPTTVFYQKHMAHHLPPPGETGIAVDWIDGLTNALLIREPRAMLASLLKVIPNPDAEATGLPQQVVMFERTAEKTGSPPPIVDSRDVLLSPGPMLERLCGALGVPYTDAMLSWEAGPRATDGVWAPYWYASVERSTGFAPYEPSTGEVPGRFLPLLSELETMYERLAAHRLTIDDD